MRDRVISAAVLLVASLILFSDIRLMWANGEPEKVVEGKYVVSLVLVPQGEEMSLRFFFRDFKTGERLLVPISFQIKIRDHQAQKFVFESPNLRASNGVGELAHQFSVDGFYEVFLEFEKADELGKIYRPDDWYLWVPAGQAAETHGYYGIIAISGLLVTISGVAWWSRRKRNRGKRIHGASRSKELR
ncbi:MAG TPA: hypothetical protein VGK77_15100 [Candidatus Binatia bacterium]